MARVAIVCGAVLVLLGLGGYFGTGTRSVTALIPAFFGLPLAILGLIGRAEQRRRHALHAATVLALLGLLGTVRGLPQFGQLITGGEVARPAATIAQAVMAVVCLVFLVLAVRSFVEARRNRAA